MVINTNLLCFVVKSKAFLSGYGEKYESVKIEHKTVKYFIGNIKIDLM